MLHRSSPRSATPLRRKQEELARRESELRESVERLERSIAAAPRIAEERSRRQLEEQHMQADMNSRFDASVARHAGRSTGRRRSLRKERREGRLIFLVLVIALAAAVIWLMSHLHF
jgi:hypothetical protein